jgi:hypothetical protein
VGPAAPDNAVAHRVRAALDDPHQRCPLGIVELRAVARRLAADQTSRPLGVEALNPVMPTVTISDRWYSPSGWRKSARRFRRAPQ